MGVGFRAQHSSGLSAPDKPCRASRTLRATRIGVDRRRTGRAERPVSTSISQLRRRLDVARRAPRSCSSGGGNQGVSQVGMLRALLERDIVPDVVIGTLGRRVQRRRSSRRTPNLAGVEQLVAIWESLRGEEVFPGGRLRRAWNLLTRDDHLFDNEGLRALIADGATPPPTFADLAGAAAGRRRRPRHGRGGRVRRAARSSPALLASAALPGLFPPIRHDGRVLVDGAVVDTVPLSHALAGPVDRDLRAERRRRAAWTDPLRSPLDVVMRASRSAASSASSSSCAACPRASRSSCCPRPIDDRESVRLLRRAAAHRRGVPARRAVARRRRRRQAQAPHPPPPLVAPHAAESSRSLRRRIPASRALARWRATRSLRSLVAAYALRSR